MNTCIQGKNHRYITLGSISRAESRNFAVLVITSCPYPTKISRTAPREKKKKKKTAANVCNVRTYICAAKEKRRRCRTETTGRRHRPSWVRYGSGMIFVFRFAVAIMV